MRDNLIHCVELEPLLVNRHSHPAIVDVFSKIFYDDCMKPDSHSIESTVARQFPLHGLHSRVIFLHVERSVPTTYDPSTQVSKVRNEAEALAVKDVVEALTSIGETSILKMSPFKLQADHINGSTVITAQGREASVAITTLVNYRAEALSMRDSIINTAGTRAQNLVLFVVNVHEIRANVSPASGLRRLLQRCPYIIASTFCRFCGEANVCALQASMISPSSKKKRRKQTT